MVIKERPGIMDIRNFLNTLGACKVIPDYSCKHDEYSQKFVHSLVSYLGLVRELLESEVYLLLTNKGVSLLELDSAASKIEDFSTVTFSYRFVDEDVNFLLYEYSWLLGRTGKLRLLVSSMVDDWKKKYGINAYVYLRNDVEQDTLEHFIHSWSKYFRVVNTPSEIGLGFVKVKEVKEEIKKYKGNLKKLVKDKNAREDLKNKLELLERSLNLLSDETYIFYKLDNKDTELTLQYIDSKIDGYFLKSLVIKKIKSVKKDGKVDYYPEIERILKPKRIFISTKHCTVYETSMLVPVLLIGSYIERAVS